MSTVVGIAQSPTGVIREALLVVSARLGYQEESTCLIDVIMSDGSVHFETFSYKATPLFSLHANQ
jgi:hypothetical protein